MEVFNLTDLARNWSAMKHAATRAPVSLTERRRPRFILMAIEDYQKLTARGEDPRRAFPTDAIPQDIEGPLLAGLDRLIDGAPT